MAGRGELGKEGEETGPRPFQSRVRWAKVTNKELIMALGVNH